MTDAELSTFSRPGFTPLFDEGGFRLRYDISGALHGHLFADLFCRGKLLDGTAGVPSRIAARLSGVKEGLDEGHLVAPWQRHGGAVVEGRPVWALPQRPKADGLLLDTAFNPAEGIWGSLRFADCAPILVASVHPHPWALMLHSGFRGTLFGIFPAAWRAVRSRYGIPDLSRTYAWIGPSIGPCCYTRKLTDPLTRRAIEKWGRFASAEEGGMARLDLLGVIGEQLREVGLPDENIYRMDLCTSCHSDRFYSYRAGDLDDRLVLLAKIL